MNKVLICGNLAKDVEIRVSRDGVKICKGVIAVKRAYSKKNETDFIPFTVLGNSAEYAQKRGHKGSRVEIVGSWNHGTYVDSEGNKRASDCCLVDEITIIQKPTETKPDNEVVDIDNCEDDDLPF